MANIVSYKRNAKRFSKSVIVKNGAIAGALSFGQSVECTGKPLGKFSLTIESSDRHYVVELSSEEALRIKDYLNEDTSADYLNPIGFDAGGSPTANPKKVFKPLT